MHLLSFGDACTPTLALREKSLFHTPVITTVLVSVSYLELYNEMVNDLLEPMNTNLKIRMSPNKVKHAHTPHLVLFTYSDTLKGPLAAHSHTLYKNRV